MDTYLGSITSSVARSWSGQNGEVVEKNFVTSVNIAFRKLKRYKSLDIVLNLYDPLRMSWCGLCDFAK